MEDASAPGTVTAFDRSADERTDPDLITRLVADAQTRVLLVDGDRVPSDASGALTFVSVAVAREIAAALAASENARDTGADPVPSDSAVPDSGGSDSGGSDSAVSDSVVSDSAVSDSAVDGIPSRALTAADAAVADTTAPGTTAPGTTARGTSVPDTTATGKTAIGTSVPGTTAIGTSVPGTTAPGTSVLDTTATGTTAPGTTAPGTTAPSERFAFLGRRDGVAVLLSAVPGAAELAQDPTTGAAPDPAVGDGSVSRAGVATSGHTAHLQPAAWASLRVLHPVLAPADGALLLEAVSLARWIVDAGHCAFCGAEARLTTGGWARSCTSCGREHFPRTDPAVIVAVTDGDRLLLGSNAMWEQRRYSCFAGFVEAGESLEEAVRREVKEESGIDVEHVSYVGSQAWPFPRSLMLGFRAHARDARTAHPDGEEILDVRWFTRAEIRAAYAGELDLLLPGKPSIAHELISRWASETEGVGADAAAGERA